MKDYRGIFPSLSQIKKKKDRGVQGRTRVWGREEEKEKGEEEGKIKEIGGRS